MTYYEGQKLHDEKCERCEHHGASGDGGKMSNENQETIADIVADIRAQNQGLPEDDYALSPLVCDLLSISDRIEAAAKREVAELRSENARLRAALRPVLECKVMSAMTAEIGPGKSEYCAAIIEKAQRIYNEGEVKQTEGVANVSRGV